jgi:hypothetical protein
MIDHANLRLRRDNEAGSSSKKGDGGAKLFVKDLGIAWGFSSTFLIVLNHRLGHFACGVS